MELDLEVLAKAKETREYKKLCSQYGEKLVETEYMLELRSQAIATNKFLKNLERNRQSGDIEKLGTTKEIIKEAIPVLTAAIDNWFKEVDTGKPGKRHKCSSLARMLESDKIAFLTLKVLFASVFSEDSNNTLNKVSTNIANALEEELRFNKLYNTLSNKEKASVFTGLNKRIGYSYKRLFLKNIEKKLIGEERLDEWERWTNANKVSIGLKLIELTCSSTKLFYLSRLAPRSNDSFIVSLDKDVMKYIVYQDKRFSQFVSFYRPTVIPPKPWTSPIEGAYYVDVKKPAQFIRMPKKKLMTYMDVSMPKVYEAVNTIQNTKWRINKKVLEVAEQVSDMIHIPEELDFPSIHSKEPPIRPQRADTNEEVQIKWRHDMSKYYQEDNVRKSKRLRVSLLLSLANTYKDFDTIYFPHNIDFRGRVYPLTTLSPQGDDFCKALLRFSEGVRLGEDGATWLAIQGANCYGLDKKPMEERLEWVYTNGDFITAIANDPINNIEWMSTDSPWEFLAFCFEWARYLKVGKTYKSRIPVALDGSCSGIQHYSAMLRDEVGGVAVNLVPDDKVHDIYKIVADAVTELVRKDALEGTEDTLATAEDGTQYVKLGTKTLAKEWLDFGINRYVTKRPVMTLPYGAAQFGFKEQILEDTIYPALSKHPDAFKRPSQSATYMAGLILVTVKKVVVKAMEAMEWLQSTSSLLAKERDINGNQIPTYWITPAGLPVYQTYEQVSYDRVSTFLKGGVKIKYMLDKGEEAKGGDEDKRIRLSIGNIKEGTLDVRKQRQGIAPNFVHSLDASHLMLTVLACKEQGIDAFAMIHDSYGTHAGKAGDLFRIVREVFVDTYTTHDMINYLHEQTKQLLSPKSLKQLKEPPARGNLDINVVKESLYAFS